MVSKKFVNNLFETLKQRIYSQDFKRSHSLNKTSFSRNRLLTFPELCSFILGVPKKSLCTELELFFDCLRKPVFPTKQAFSKAQQQISFEAFQELFYLSNDILDFSKNPNLWNGYSVFAIDGMNLSLPVTTETQEEFGILHRFSKNCVAPKVSALYDITNDLIVRVYIGTVKTDADERSHAKELILSPVLDRRGTENCIIVFDRGYPGRELIYSLTERKFPFLMRCSKSFLKEVNQAPIGDTFIIDEHKGISTPLRVLKFPLDSGEIEMLVTNILSDKLSIEDFKKLYFMRWGIETKFGELKNRILIEHFTSKKVNGIKQEFYAHLLLSNIAALLKNISDQKIQAIQEIRDLKYRYQTNRSYLLGVLAKKMWKLDHHSINKLINDILEKAVKKRSPLRPNRKCERLGAQYRKTFDMNLKTHL